MLMSICNDGIQTIIICTGWMVALIVIQQLNVINVYIHLNCNDFNLIDDVNCYIAVTVIELIHKETRFIFCMLLYMHRQAHRNQIISHCCWKNGNRVCRFKPFFILAVLAVWVVLGKEKFVWESSLRTTKTSLRIN